MNIEDLDKKIIKPEFVQYLKLNKIDTIPDGNLLRITLELEDSFETLSNSSNFSLLLIWFKYNEYILIDWDIFTTFDTGKPMTFVCTLATEKFNGILEIIENLGLELRYDYCKTGNCW